MCLAIAVLMIVNGKGLVSVMPYVIMVCYAAASLWGITTFRTHITVRQFAVEMAVLVAGTLLLRAASPEMFSVEAPAAVEAQRAIVKPRLPTTALGRYCREALGALRASGELLEVRGRIEPLAYKALVAQLKYDELDTLHGLLDGNDQARVYAIHRRAAKFGSLLVEAIQAHGRDSQPGVPFVPSTDQHREIARGLQEALTHAENLKTRILVVPTTSDRNSIRSGEAFE